MGVFKPTVFIGYVRVSKTSQTTEQQVDSLRTIGAIAVYVNGVSVSQRDRDGLSAALAELQPGDALAVVALDRLGRNLSDLVQIVERRFIQSAGTFARSARTSTRPLRPAGCSWGSSGHSRSTNGR